MLYPETDYDEEKYIDMYAALKIIGRHVTRVSMCK